MAVFSLDALKPASSIEGLARANTQGPKTARETALANIDAQLALLDPKKEGRRTFWDTVVNNKRSFTGQGASVGFYVKVGSTKLMLGGTQEPGVAKGEFEATLKAIKAAIQQGKLDEQFATLDGAKTARTDKLRQTRAAKKGETKAA